jgi:hypothetical protein
MRELSKKEMDKILEHLNNILALEDAPPIEIVVCGGSSLSMTGLISRTTEDVDVVGLMSKNEHGEKVIIPSKPLPDFLSRAVHRVAQDFRLFDNWMNTGPSSIALDGLPDGFTDRLIGKKYGEHLLVYFIARLDQIHFKLYAASYPDNRHLQDLITLKPTEEEIEQAARWTIKHWPVDNYHQKICREIIRELGYEGVAGRISE